jgi:hypothetical protein
MNSLQPTPDTALERVISDELKSGLKVTLVDESGELYGRVSWIAWDSGFRESGLEVEDRIIAIQRGPFTLPEDPKERRIARDRFIGGLNEAKLFADLGLKDGSPLALTVLRRQLPGRGWTRLEITGAVRAERLYYTTDDKSAVAPGGPERLGKNDVGETWMSWLERREFEWSSILDGRWLTKFNSRVELAKHLELKPRVDHALATYPGEFSKRLAEDWERVARSLRGRRVELTTDALAFREHSDVVEKEIAAAGDAAWTAFLAAHDAVDTLPTLDLVRDDRGPLVGKVIALTGLTWRESVKDGDRSVFVTSHSGHHCYVTANQPSMQTFWSRLGEYQARVEPRVAEHYDAIGRVMPDTTLVVTPRGGAKIGLSIEVLAVRIPGHFFADVTGNAVTFAGAERATARGAAASKDDAGPSDVMRACVQAVKLGDERLWLALYADWVAWSGGARPYYRAFAPYRNYMPDYTRARQLLLHKVAHVEPAWESEAAVVLRGDEFDGAPKIEQVHVLMDHIGEFDEGAHVFCTNELTRVWTLQRRNGGPWRICSRNAL